ncbi:MAG: type II toxin-antitoxin system Phd/YefM family antitoxin [Candidatus Cyclonatronum sp.]|uniref:type II toxin-antitoxin system Phd/YefM family antitoxin n=1 Tax=Cyclonatronum sp. TaxID=3024185 RepID=UPI0025BD1BA5|nr:type II toxin-antitoxin system Phd/YefM family antitoxin [Cyclonatronum sp.]MCH8486835.1 type II toxin-antitoxin system Phd/YefM family antitoxin [Cyclonatronum sp.]
MATARLDINKDIQPVSEFRKHAADFIDRIKTEKRPIVLTQHGKSAAVLVDVSEYQRMQEKIELMEDLLEAERQISAGRVLTHEEAKQRIKENLTKWK